MADEPNLYDQTKLLYQSRLELVKTVCGLLSSVSVSPEKVLQMVDALEARLLSPNLQRCWVIALNRGDGGHPGYFCGWGGPWPAWTDHPSRAVLFAREQDAQEVIHSLPLEFDDGRENMRAVAVGGPV